MAEEYKSLLSGNFEIAGLPDVPSKLIRVYLACTPTDMVQERDALVKKVYPRLREYAREKFSMDFQVVDMRWGQEEEWPDNGTDRALCMREVCISQNSSVGPSFVGLIGQRYGDRPLPVSIAESDFDLIRSTLRHHRNRETRDAWLLDQFYHRDTNAIPPVYLLQPIEAVRENLKPKNAVDRLIIGDKEPEWPEIKTSLKRLLQRGVEYCLLEGSMVESDVQDYLISDLERECRQGVLFSSEPESNCQIFQRCIVDLKNYISHPRASKFMEITFNEKENKMQTDSEAEKKLNSLLDDKISKWLPASNISDFSVLWKHDIGIHPELHEDYLQEFCDTFEIKLRALIDASALTQISEPLPHIVDEAFQHWLAVKYCVQYFTGRDDVLDIIRSYAQSNDTKPLILYGESGSGKTSLIGKAAAEMAQWLPGDVVTIVRFIGLTAASFDIRQILHNICLQLVAVLDRSCDEVPNSYKDLIQYFHDLLTSFPDNKNLVIFMDSLHILVPQYNAHLLLWVPSVLKENVKVIMTTAPETHGILPRLKESIILDENNFVEVPPFSIEESMGLIKSLMAQEHRTLTESQLQVVEEAFRCCSSPLYVQLIANDTRTWTSMMKIEASALPSGVKECINSFLDRLERTHGRVLVSHSLAYLTASTTGLSDNEMEHVLSLDDAVLNEVYAGRNITVHRIPPIFWQKVKHELRDFLVKRDSEGMTTLYWNHRFFIETAKTRYLNDESKRKLIHAGLADYMLGVWHLMEKPFKVDGSEKVELADRLVPSQPLTFEGVGGVVRFNKRKYDQVPRHLYLSGRLEELNELVLFSYKWLYNKTRALSLEHILADFVLNPSVEATLVERALRDAQPLITQNVNNMASEISGRLLVYYNTHPNIRKLIKECDTIGLYQCGLVPNFPYHQVPGSPLKYSIESQGMPSSFCLTGGDSRFIFIKEPSSQKVQIYDLATGELSADILTSVGQMHLTPDSSTLIVVDHLMQKSIKLHNSSTGQFLGQLIPQNQVQVTPKEKYRLGKVSLSDSHLCLAVTTEKSYLCVAKLDACKFLHVKGLDSRASVCEMTHDSQFVFCNSNKDLYGFDIDSLEQVNHTPLEHRPSQLIFNQEGTRGYMINDEENKVYVMTLRDGAVDFMYKIVLTEPFHDDRICDLKLSNSQELLLARGQSNLVVYNTQSERINCHFPRPPEVPMEFKLPKSHYQDIHFTAADFSPDDKFVIASIFRNVYIWHLANKRLLTTLQAPVGIITEMFVPKDRGQIVTHLDGSDVVHVWSLGDAIGQVGTLDRLTTAIMDIKFTRNSGLAYVRCEDSDELGAMDMATGQLVDLLTHESPVERFSISASGDYALVSLKSARAGAFNKIWHTAGRKIMHEFGNCVAYSVPLANEDCIIALIQETAEFKAPYDVLMYKLVDGSYEEMTYDCPVAYVLQEPFVTPDDRYLVILSANGYDEKSAHYEQPRICAISMRCNSPMNTFSAQDLCDSVRIRRILRVQPYAASAYTVLVLYTSEAERPPYDHCYGFMVFDLCSGVVCHVIEDFLTPSTPLDQVLFTPDAQFCLDHQSNLFDLQNGYFLKSISANETCRPRCLALGGRVALYVDGEQLSAVRLSDGSCLAQINVHGEISQVALCHDLRTLVVGCKDGALVSYVLIDPCTDDPEQVLAATSSRKGPAQSSSSSADEAMVRSWDKIDQQNGPPYSRPPSAMNMGPPEKELLRQIKPASLSRPGSDTLLYQNPNSRACAVM